MQSLQKSRLLKLGMVGALALGVFAAGFMNNNNRALAQDAAHQTFMVQAGGFGAANVEVLAFAPSVVQVHRGDTVMWHIASFHNVHVGEAPSEFVVVSEVDGQPVPQINPAVGLPSIESGADYTGGDVSSGLPQGDVLTGTFSLVIDLEPGTYAYFCDVHPGMTGVIEVLPDDQAVPSPSEQAAQGSAELDEQVNAGVGASFMMAATAPTQSVDGVLMITVGSGGTGRATVNQFNSAFATIHAGESVTWTNPADSIEAHFINSADYDPAALPDIVPIMQENAPPILSAGPGFLGTTADGSEIKAGDSFNSTSINPGQTFTLTFTEAGVYAYFCHIHPGMNGVIVVQPAS